MFGIPFSPDRASDKEEGDLASPTGDGSGAAPFRGTIIQLCLTWQIRKLYSPFAANSIHSSKSFMS